MWAQGTLKGLITFQLLHQFSARGSQPSSLHLGLLSSFSCPSTCRVQLPFLSVQVPHWKNFLVTSPQSIPQHRAFCSVCAHWPWSPKLLENTVIIYDSSIVSVTLSTVPWEDSQRETVSIRLTFGHFWGLSWLWIDGRRHSLKVGITWVWIIHEQVQEAPEQWACMHAIPLHFQLWVWPAASGAYQPHSNRL